MYLLHEKKHYNLAYQISLSLYDDPDNLPGAFVL